VGPFGNDAAGDFLDELANAGTALIPNLLAEKFRTVLAWTEELDSWEVQQAIAGAALVARRLSEGLAVPPDAEEFLVTHRFDVSEELRSLAAQALMRMVRPDDNEWYDLWADSNGMDEVQAALHPFVSVLARTEAASTNPKDSA
jgi:hypothetical protein